MVIYRNRRICKGLMVLVILMRDSRAPTSSTSQPRAILAWHAWGPRALGTSKGLRSRLNFGTVFASGIQRLFRPPVQFLPAPSLIFRNRGLSDHPICVRFLSQKTLPTCFQGLEGAKFQELGCSRLRVTEFSPSVGCSFARLILHFHWTLAVLMRCSPRVQSSYILTSSHTLQY